MMLAAVSSGRADLTISSLTKDDVPVVFHDLELERVTDVEQLYPDRRRADGHWYVVDFTYAELQRLSVHERVQPGTGAPAWAGRFHERGLSLQLTGTDYRVQLDEPAAEQHREVWGQGFAAPTFSEEVEVVSQRLVGEKHLSLKLKHQGQPVDGIWFGHTEPLPAKVTLAFRLDADEWNGVRRVRFLVEGAAH